MDNDKDKKKASDEEWLSQFDNTKGIRIRVNVGHSDVSITMTEPVSYISMDPLSAMELADKIREAAQIVLASDA